MLTIRNRIAASRRTAAVVVVLLLGALAVGRPAGADTEEELERAKAELVRLVDRIEEGQAEIARLQGDVAALSSRISRVEARIAETLAEIAKVQARIEKATEEMRELQDQLDRRAWVAYQTGPGTSIEFVLGSTSLADLSARLEIVDRAAASDQELIDAVQNRRAGLERQRLDLERLQRSLERQRRELEVQREAMQAKLSRANELVAELNTDRAAAERLVEKLRKKREAEIAAAREAARLAELATLRTGGSTEGAVGRPFEVCPVDQPRGYSNDYGAPRYTGGYHPHAGNDIFAPLGTPVRAPFDGVASEASNGIGGLSVKVHGADGYVYNAHLSAFGKLGSVRAGDVIGYVGNTGNAISTPPHDHFEWHPAVIPPGAQSFNGGVNPYPYLNQVC